MTTYNFKTSEFGLSTDGVHLFRSDFNYKTIRFSEIKRIKIEKGKELHNWWLVFLLGAALIGLGVYLSLGTIKILIEGDISPRHARMILLLLIPVAGGYFVYNSLQTGLILKIECVDGERDMFPLKDIIKKQKLKELKVFLSYKVGTRIEVSA
jgi:hypothetical protein